ncbi:protein MEMO1-like isoform X1 [Varroa jacobsoni]|uniref:protein MEMO1-like isoform X1 n=1 Tax=Varroa jacobsoni TaxID=62625 RepID=UPI000BF56029|nr:protein MEMO1-like isoform X1 [Varroa jacobsoni]
MSRSCRQATHAGSWYSERGNELRAQLEDWLQAVGPVTHSPARAVIAPHAGYRYSGPTAAYAYAQIDPDRVRKIFILGPSHHVYLDGCALSPATTYRTPFMDLPIDKGVYDELYKTGLFEEMSLGTDEDEHSIEMHLPYVAKVMERKTNGPFTIVPILVGAITTEKEAIYGRALAKYLAQDDVCFVVSSDFCHWGSRFRYQQYDKADGDIWESIEKLDRDGMRLIEALDPTGFAAYLKKTSNTICGRHPIGVLLNSVATLQQSGQEFSCKFLSFCMSPGLATIRWLLSKATFTGISPVAPVLPYPSYSIILHVYHEIRFRHWY